MTTSGRDSAIARSTARQNFSPTTIPMDPPRNEKSITASITPRPRMKALPTRMASLAALAWADLSRSQ